MKDFGFVKTVAGAVLCGLGVTYGLVLSRFQGGGAWLVAAIMVVAGVALAAFPMPRRRAR